MRSRRGSWLFISLLATSLAVAPAVPAGAGPATAAAGGREPHGSLMQVVYGSPSATPRGYSPVTIQRYYHFNAMGNDAEGNPITGTGQTIAVVLWDNYPEAAADLQAFITKFKLPPMLGLGGKRASLRRMGPSLASKSSTLAARCPTRPPAARSPSTDGEYAMDIEWAHVAAPGANIVMVQGQGTHRFGGQWFATVPELDQAIQTAEKSGASVVSMSFGSTAMTAVQAATWDQADVALVSGEGDDGYPDTEYPPADTMCCPSAARTSPPPVRRRGSTPAAVILPCPGPDTRSTGPQAPSARSTMSPTTQLGRIRRGRCTTRLP